MLVVVWILLGVLILIAGLILSPIVTPVRIKLEYVTGWRIRVYLLGVIRVFDMSSPFELDFTEEPSKETEQKSEQPKKKTQETEHPSILEDIKAFFKEEGIGGVLELLRRLTEMLSKTVSTAARAVTVRKLALCVRVGAGEADNTALTYGAVSAALSTAYSALSAVVRIKRPCIRVIPDFTTTSCNVKFRMILWVWPLGMVAALAVMAWHALCLWLQTFGKKRTTTEAKTVET